MFGIPITGHDFQGFTRYQVLLTVTDADGLQQTSSVIIYPDKVNLNVDTVPSGLTVTMDGISKTTPFVLDSLKGFLHSLGAPNQTKGSTSYTFASWSDGGAQTHDITTPEQAATYVATFNGVPLPVVPGLVAAYSFDQGSGTAVADASGNNNTGSIVGTTPWTTAGKFDGALSFNGTNSRVEHPQLVFPAAQHRDDPRGLGEPLDRDEQMARRDRERQRRLLPDGDLLPLLHPCGQCERLRDPCAGLRHLRARDGNLHLPGGHLRRGHGQALRGPPPPTSPSWRPRRPPVPS